MDGEGVKRLREVINLNLTGTGQHDWFWRWMVVGALAAKAAHR